VISPLLLFVNRFLISGVGGVKGIEYILFDLGSALGWVGVRSSDDAYEDKGLYDG
jgi:hypothetical protein